MNITKNMKVNHLFIFKFNYHVRVQAARDREHGYCNRLKTLCRGCTSVPQVAFLISQGLITPFNTEKHYEVVTKVH